MRKPNVESYLGGYLVGGQLIQSDWDFPPTAQRCGWSILRVQRRVIAGEIITVHLTRAPKPIEPGDCEHGGTDGTVDCDCGVTASEFIAYAAEYLDSLC